MKSIKVCAIIVTYNGSEWIDQCFKSVRSSSIPLDIYVVDNKSQDDTLEQIAKLKCNFLHESSENLGFGKANNIALKKAFGDGYDYFLLLNQDAKVEPEVAESLISSMQKEKEFGITSPMHFNWSGSRYDPFFESYLSRMDEYQKDLKANQIKVDQLYESIFINAACWMISREALQQVGLFHPLFYHYGEDDNYLNRLRYHGFKLGLNTNVKMYHDREDRGDNPLKDDPYRLFRRTVLGHLLDPLNDNRVVFKNARKLARQLSKQFYGLQKYVFRVRCRIEYWRLKHSVKNFESQRKHELLIQ